MVVDIVDFIQGILVQQILIDLCIDRPVFHLAERSKLWVVHHVLAVVVVPT